MTSSLFPGAPAGLHTEAVLQLPELTLVFVAAKPKFKENVKMMTTHIPVYVNLNNPLMATSKVYIFE
jgi:hypothetical protein